MNAGSVDDVRVARVVVWRHGRTTWNATGRFQGQADPPLDPVGIEQSRRSASILAVDPPELILTSDLVRASSTADALAQLVDSPVRLEPRLREIDLGSWQGLTRDEVAATYPEQYSQWLAGSPEHDRGGETRSQLDARVRAMLCDIEVDHALLVTHGGTARSIIETLLGLPHPGRWLAVLGNCHWSQLQRTARGWQLRSHNLAPDVRPPSLDADASAAEQGDADAVNDPGDATVRDDDAGART